MSESTTPTIPIPREGFLGIQALIAIGEERLAKLAEVMAAEPLVLSFTQLSERLSELLGCDQRTLQLAFVHALVPLNGLRRTLEMSPSGFLSALGRTISERGSVEWKNENLEEWERISGKLSPFLQPDNFFSQASKAFDLLSERPAVLQGARLLTELRPIFDEAATGTLTHLLTNTLVVDYWDGQNSQSLHVSLDSSDLEKLAKEIERAKRKINVCRKEAADLGTNLVIYGDPSM